MTTSTRSLTPEDITATVDAMPVMIGELFNSPVWLDTKTGIITVAGVAPFRWDHPMILGTKLHESAAKIMASS